MTLRLEVPIIAGEVCHQLRSSLDHLVWQLVVAHTGNIPGGTRSGFPIFVSEERYEKRGRPMIVGVSNKAAYKIRFAQPFNAPDQKYETLLWAIHELNNTDKHRIIPLTVLHASVVSGSIATPQGTVDLTEQLLIRNPLSDGLVVYRQEKPNTDATFNFPIGVATAFVELGGLRMHPAVPLLKEMTDYVERLLTSFESDF